jgi:stage VI sporulation protein D
LEESLWFRKGQEVAELVSISLDPDITIQENDQYVTIRGSLELTGEYKSYEDSIVNEDETVSTQKYVERVDTQEEGNCEFSHRFPVDITIPNNRIQSIYDIDVIVESFDYSLPERSCLKLTAELTISGLYDASQQESAVEEEPEYEVVHRYQAEAQEAEEEQEEPEYEVLHRYQAEEQEEDQQSENSFLFEAEARKKQEEKKEEAFPQFPNFTYQAYEEEEEEEFHTPAWSFQEARSEAIPQPVEEPEEVIEEVVEEPPKQPIQEQPKEPIKEPIEEQPKEPVVEAMAYVDESSSSPEAPPKQQKQKKAPKKKSMTLTEFFARKEENSEQARLKVCIVQKGDTLDGLADRYDVSVVNLLRVNNLELNQDVYEGQVLYVPVAFAKK